MSSVLTSLPEPGTVLKIRIDSQLHIPKESLSWDVQSRLKAMFSKDNPLYAKAQSAGRKTFGINRQVQGWSVEEGWEGEDLVLPRGRSGQIVALLRKQGFVVEVEREACEGMPLTATFMGQLRPYQRAAVQALAEGVQGLVVAPCGAGKTEIGCAALAQVGRTTLILVHTRDLLEQWVERIQLRLGLQAGVVGDGKRNVQPITVAMLQTIARMPEPEVIALGRRFGTLITDEVHHLPCMTLSKAVNLLPCRWRWGLSATPEREDGLHFVLEWVLGPELHRIDPALLIESGHLLPATICEVRTGWTTKQDASEQYAKVIEELTLDPARNQLIVDLVAGELAGDGTVLVLSTRKQHCEDLAQLLLEAGHQVAVLTADKGKKLRTSTLDQLRSGALRCVVATQLADEGLDVPRLTAVVLAAPSRAMGKTIQRLGRVMRPYPGKGRPRLYDLVDDVGVMRGQARTRQKAYKQVLGQVQTQVIDLNQLELGETDR